MITIQDFNNWNEYNGVSEGSGRSEKVWLISNQEEIGLFKFPKIDPTTSQETTEHISEHLAHQLGQVLGVSTARVDIGIRRGRIGSMSYLVSERDEQLKEGIGFISGSYSHYDADNMIDLRTGQYYCLEHIFQSTQKFIPKKIWIEMMIFDFLIGNKDRHQSNWAILESTDSNKQTRIRKCPLYDNGSSLCCYVNDGLLDQMFGRDPGPFRALTDTKSRSIIRIDGSRKAQPPHKKVIQHLLLTYPETLRLCKRFLERLNPEIIDNLLSTYQPELLNPRKNELIRRFLKRKLEILGELIEGGS